MATNTTPVRYGDLGELVKQMLVRIIADINAHNTDAAAHDDIRQLVQGLDTRLTTLCDCDDTTLDQLSEIVAYIKNNKDLIDGVTTSKVNVADVKDNLTSTDTDKPLSANQGKVLDEKISAINTSIAGTLTADDITALFTAADEAIANPEPSPEA